MDIINLVQLRYKVLIALVFLNSVNTYSSIKGIIQIDPTWNSVAYLSLISGFDQLNSMSNQMIIDQAKLDENGNFSFETNYLPAKNLLYRLHLSKKGDPPASLIIGGKEENHMFFIANRNSSMSIICNSSETLFGNVVIENSPQSQLINEVNKMLLYVDTTNFYNTALKRELMGNAMDEKLRQFADTSSFPLVALYAIYKSNFESHVKTNPDFYIRFLEKWEKEKSPYFDEFKKKIPVKQARNYSLPYGFLGLLIGMLVMFVFRKRKIVNSQYPMQELTIQERNIYGLLQKGKSNKEISDELNISLSTVKSHVNSIFSKLNIKSRKEVIDF